jgi:hypothetical protein
VTPTSTASGTATATPSATATPTNSAVPQDIDTDDDGIPDSIEGTGDEDGDGIPNNRDLDSDNDGIFDITEGGGNDINGDGIADSLTDNDGDGLVDHYDPDNGGASQPTIDTDSDGKSDFLDRDSDGDGILDVIEGQDGNSFVPASGNDTDDDGIDDAFDPDLRGPWTPIPDVDGDGAPDFRDVDADGDGLGDRDEAYDFNGDGVSDVTPAGVDSDGDGLDDAYNLYARPDSMRTAWRELPATSQCRQISIQKQIHKVIRALFVIRGRTEMFSDRAKNCGGAEQIDRLDLSRNMAQELRAILLIGFEGAVYRCPTGVCRTLVHSTTKRQLRTLARRVGLLAKLTKIYAMKSCNVKPEPPGRPKTRKTSDDYTKDLVAAIDKLPNKFSRCP